MGIVVFSLMPAGRDNVLHRMHQVAVGDHGMVRRPIELFRTVVLGGAPLMLRGVLQKFRSFQMMINALL